MKTGIFANKNHQAANLLLLTRLHIIHIQLYPSLSTNKLEATAEIPRVVLDR